MIREIALIEVTPGREEAFEAGVREAAPLFLRARGCHGMHLERGIEHPSRYRLVVLWETVEDHMFTFRESADFQEWRRLVGPCFAAPPQVEHTQEVVTAA